MILRKIVVGLGNPDEEYHSTPHNLGFEVVDLLVAEGNSRWVVSDCLAMTARLELGDYQLILAKPQTYMNLSGKSVACLMEEFSAPVGDLIVTCDDLALPFGKIRVRGRGSSGGHRGLESIIEWLNSDEFIRVRLGIAPELPIVDASQYVLSPIRDELRELADLMIHQSREAIKMIVLSGLHMTMNRFN